MGQRNRYRLEYAPVAYEDLEGIYTYIATELLEPDTSYALVMRIEAAIQALQEFPYKASVARDAMLVTKGYRLLTVENFAVFYIVDDEQQIVSIRHILYGKRNFRWLL